MFKARSKRVTQERLKSLLYYDPLTGFFMWKRSGTGRKSLSNPGNKRLFVNGKTYLSIGVDGRLYSAHHLAWLYVHGCLPKALDHIDGNGINNAIKNLREADHSVNAKNQRLFSNNSSGFAGVYWMKANEKWHARICVNRKSIHLGFFNNKADAVKVRIEAEIYHGFHSNHGTERPL
jgi:hypothetical protein